MDDAVSEFLTSDHSLFRSDSKNVRFYVCFNGYRSLRIRVCAVCAQNDPTLNQIFISNEIE